jgi:hypothetical protein
LAISRITGRMSRLTMASSSAADTATSARGVSPTALSVTPGISQAVASRERAFTTHITRKRTRYSMNDLMALVIAPVFLFPN